MTARTIFTLFLCTMLLSGCWDRTEIERVGFVLAVGLDPVQQEGQMTGGQDKKIHQFQSTFQIAIPGKIGPTASKQTGRAYFTISDTGTTNFKTARDVTAQESRKLNFEHLKVLIINEKLAKKGILHYLMDLYIRDHEMRRQTYLYISKENTKTLLDKKLPLTEIMGQSIAFISENYTRTLEMIKPSEIGDVSEFVIQGRSFVVSKISDHQPRKIDVSKVAVFNETKMMGWLNGEETAGYNWIVGKGLNGVLEAKYQGLPVVFETTAHKTRITYKRKDGKDQFQIQIRAEGNLAESWNQKIDLTKPQTYLELQNAFSKKIEELAKKAITKAQKEYHSDIFQLYSKVENKEYQYWKKAKKKWDKKDGGFAKAEIKVQADVQLRNYMLNEKLRE